MFAILVFFFLPFLVRGLELRIMPLGGTELPYALHHTLADMDIRFHHSGLPRKSRSTRETIQQLQKTIFQNSRRRWVYSQLCRLSA